MNSISSDPEKLKRVTEIEKVDEYRDQFEYPGPTAQVKVIRIGPDLYERIEDYDIRWRFHDKNSQEIISDNFLRSLETLYQLKFAS